jgi:hypothetical protein
MDNFNCIDQICHRRYLVTYFWIRKVPHYRKTGPLITLLDQCKIETCGCGIFGGAMEHAIKRETLATKAKQRCQNTQ